jgi:hypothetical protein
MKRTTAYGLPLTQNAAQPNATATEATVKAARANADAD